MVSRALKNYLKLIVVLAVVIINMQISVSNVYSESGVTEYTENSSYSGLTDNNKILLLGSDVEGIVFDSSDLIFKNNTLNHNYNCNGTIKIYNTSDVDKYISLVEILDNTESNVIYTVAQLEIFYENKQVYTGGYSENISPLMNAIMVPANGSIELYVKSYCTGLEESITWGELDTTWVFESTNKFTGESESEVEYTIHCVDATGKEIKYEKAGCKSGDIVTIQPPVISGYTTDYNFKDVRINSNGAGVVFKYYKDESNDVIAVQEDKSTGENQSIILNEEKSVEVEDKKTDISADNQIIESSVINNNEQSGENYVILITVGVLTIVTISGLYVIKIVKKYM